MIRVISNKGVVEVEVAASMPSPKEERFGVVAEKRCCVVVVLMGGGGEKRRHDSRQNK